jgi:hypothetical protein
MRRIRKCTSPSRRIATRRKLAFERLESRYLLAAAVNKNQLVFDAVLGGSASAAKTITVSNTGTQALTLSSISITGANAALFSTPASNSAPVNIAPGASFQIGIVFNPPSSESPGPKLANLHLETNNPATPAFDVYLGGLATVGEEGANEPSLQWILDTFRIPVSVGDPNAPTATIETASLPNSNNIERFVKAGPGAVIIEALAIFSGNTFAQPAAIVGWYTSPTSLNELMRYGTGSAGQHQEMNPSTQSGSNSFDPGTASFGMYSQWPLFPGRTVYSQNSLNTFDKNTQKQLVYPLREIDGTIVPNTYIVAVEAASNKSFQDLVYVFRNVSPLLPGDYNQDQTVDAADYVLWRKNQGNSTGLPNENASPGSVSQEDHSIWRSNLGRNATLLLPGDYNQDQTVDAADYVLWRKNLGKSPGLPNEDATPGIVTHEDRTIWRANLGKTATVQSPGDPLLPGDYNQDQAVDAADYVLWRKNLGSTPGLPNEGATSGIVSHEDHTIWRANLGKKATLPGDYNRDQTVDAADYVVWRKNLGNPPGLPNEDATPGIVSQDDGTVWRANVGRNETLPNGSTSAFEEYKATRLWASMHFGLVTYDSVAPVEIGTGTSPINAFNPPNFIAGMEDWFDYAYKIGARGGRFVTHYWDGFCLWPSQTSSRNVSQTSWYAANGGIDPVRVYTDLCRAYGFKVGLYYNVRDFYFDSIGGGDYTQWTVDMLTELLSNYGKIDYLFLDGWGEFWSGSLGGLNYSEVDYATVINVIRTLQPECVVAINDHENSGPHHSDVRWWERPAEGVPAPGYTFYSSVRLDDTLHRDYGSGYIGRWFVHADSPPETPADAKAPIGRRFQMLRAGYGYSANFSLDGTGTLLSSTKSMLDEMWTPVGNSVVDDKFTLNGNENAPVDLESRSQWTRGLAQDETKHAVINPSGEVWANTSGAPLVYYRNDRQLTDLRVEADFVLKSVPSTFQLNLLLRSDTTGSSSDRIIFYKSGGTFGVTLATIDSGNYIPLDSMGGVVGELVVGEKYRLVVQKTGNALRGELWREDANGELMMWGKLVGASTINNSAGFAGFLLDGPASDTTGLHLTGFRVTTPDQVTPPPPVLSHSGDATGRYHIDIQKFHDAHYTKLYRSTDGGLTYTVAAFTMQDTFVDPQWAAGNTYLYRAVSIDHSWNQTGYSNLLSLTVTNSSVTSSTDAVPEAAGSGLSESQSRASIQSQSLADSGSAQTPTPERPNDVEIAARVFADWTYRSQSTRPRMVRVFDDATVRPSRSGVDQILVSRSRESGERADAPFTFARVSDFKVQVRRECESSLTVELVDSLAELDFPYE